MKTLTRLMIALSMFGTLSYAQMLAGGGSAPTMPGMNHGSMPHGSAGMMNHQMHGGMMMGGTQAQDIDRHFLTMMIPHHQSAIDMSQAILKTTKDPQIKTWATNIIRDQQREITQMQTLLKQYGGPAEGMAEQMNEMMSGMSSAKQETNKDRAFVQEMIPHHGMAVMMANHLLMQSENPVMQKLGRDIITAQASEIYEFKQYLRKAK